MMGVKAVEPRSEDNEGNALYHNTTTSNEFISMDFHKDLQTSDTVQVLEGEPFTMQPQAVGKERAGQTPIPEHRLKLSCMQDRIQLFGG